MRVIISKHARRQMEKRGVYEQDVAACVIDGEEVFEQQNGRFGVKHYSKLKGAMSDLIVVWRFKKLDKEVVTVYWRSRR